MPLLILAAALNLLSDLRMICFEVRDHMAVPPAPVERQAALTAGEFERRLATARRVQLATAFRRRLSLQHE